MLELIIGQEEVFNNQTQKFELYGGFKAQFEHSLFTIAEWESKWEVPFLSERDKKTPEQVFSYLEMMCVTPDVPPEAFQKLTQANVDAIQEYISAKKTATWIREEGPKKRGPIITNEVIYGWMVAMNVPFEPAQHWHLNHLITLLRVTNENNKPKKKMNPKSAASRMSAINAARKARLGTHG